MDISSIIKKFLPTRQADPLLFLLKRYKKALFKVMILSMSTGVLDNITLAGIHMFLKVIFKEGGNGPARELGYINYLMTVFPGRDPVVIIGIFIGLIITAKHLTAIANETMIGRVSGNTVYDLKKIVMEKYSGSKYQFFLDNKYGKLSYNALMAPAKNAALMLYLPKAGTEIIKSGLIILYLIYFNWQVTLYCAILISAYLFFTRYLSQRISYVTGQGRQKAGKDNTDEFNEFIVGIKYLKVFDQKKHWLDIFDRSSYTYSELYKKDAFWIAVPKELLEFVFFGGTIVGLVILNSIMGASVGRIVPSIGVYFMAMMKILPSVNNLGRLQMQITNLLPDAETTYQAIHEDRYSAEDGREILDKFHDSIKFDQVSFYHQGRDIILDDINLNIEFGKITAIVGESGSGKSTVLNLILKLFEPTKGRITIDGKPLNTIKTSSWLNQIGFVGQDTFIFHSTVYDNIAFGHSYNKKEVIKAAQIAGIHEFIMSLPEGYDTLVGERGMKVSGGQQQRVAIARAIIRNPGILILDEATSALDSATEKRVQQQIDKTLQGRTAVVVAHRLSTIEHADKIVVIKQGRIVEEGTHNQLLTQKGEYWKMYMTQNGKKQRTT